MSIKEIQQFRSVVIAQKKIENRRFIAWLKTNGYVDLTKKELIKKKDEYETTLEDS